MNVKSVHRMLYNTGVREGEKQIIYNIFITELYYIGTFVYSGVSLVSFQVGTFLTVKSQMLHSPHVDS